MKKIFCILAFLTVFGTAIGMADGWVYYYVPEGEKIPHPTIDTWYLLSTGRYSKEGYTWCVERECPTGYYFDNKKRECLQVGD